jgi:hypothetical protein
MTMPSLPLPRLRKPPEPPLTAREWLPLKAIRGPLSFFSGNRAARMLAVGSINRKLRSRAENRRLNRSEEELFNSLTFPIQRLSLPKPLDLSEHIMAMHQHAMDDENCQRSGLLVDKAQHIAQLIVERHLVEWRNLVVIPWDGKPGAADMEKVLAERTQELRHKLTGLGLAVTELDALEIARVWHEILHPEESARHKLTPADLEGAGEELIDRLLPPGGFDFRNAKQFRIGKKYARVIAVIRYPRKATTAHFADLYRMDRRVIVSQHIHPVPSEDLQRLISNSIGEMNTRLAGPLSEMERESTKARVRDAHRLLRKLAAENHKVHDFCMFLLLLADDLEELETLSRNVLGRLDGKGMKGQPLTFRTQAEGFLCILPAGLNPLRQLARRNIPAESMTVTFPYANAELTRGRGIVLGLNKETGNLAMLDPWLDLVNAHVIFLGMAGAGKTFAMNEQLIQLWSWGVTIRSIDIEGDKGRLCQLLGGQRVHLAPYAGNIINPMEVRRPPLDPSFFLGADAEEPANGLAATIQRQLIMFTLMLPEIRPVELAAAETILIACYERKGITFDSDFTQIPPTGWPTWRDLLPMLAEHPRTENLAAVMQSWVKGSLRGMLDGHTNVNLDNQFVLLDLHDVMGHRLAKGPLFFLAITYLWDEISRDWSERKVLDIDELGILADSEDALEFVWRVAKAARRRRCRFQGATQDPADFLSGKNEATRKYAQGIINNCATKVLGLMQGKALEQVAQVVQLSEAELELLSGMKREEKLVIAGDARAHIEVVASLEELRILDPKAYTERTGKPA